MCIYCGTNKYRKIYENHFGPIPKDNDGRTYDIHHIDGNRNNNLPDNLTAVSIQEHYDIHYKQGDWTSCILIGKRANISPEEISRISTKQNLERVKNGTHPFKGEAGKNLQRKRVENGTHNFLSGEYASRTQRKLVEEGSKKKPQENKY